MRRGPEHFGEQELSLVYIAKRLHDALRIEGILTGAGVDFLVEPDRYSGGIIFRAERVGAFFYVAPEAETVAREALRTAGFTPYATE